MFYNCKFRICVNSFGKIKLKVFAEIIAEKIFSIKKHKTMHLTMFLCLIMQWINSVPSLQLCGYRAKKNRGGSHIFPGQLPNRQFQDYSKQNCGNPA